MIFINIVVIMSIYLLNGVIISLKDNSYLILDLCKHSLFIKIDVYQIVMCIVH